MKKKILSLGVITILILMLVTLTGCGDNKETAVDNIDGNVDKGEEIIYEFEKYVQDKNTKGIATVFESNFSFLNEEFENFFKYRNDLTYEITEIYKIESEETLKEHYYSNSEDTITMDTIDNMVDSLKLGDNITVYIVKNKFVYENEAKDIADDLFFVNNENGNYKIVYTHCWATLLQDSMTNNR